MDELLEDTTGSYVGIGVYMADNTADNTILIIGVIEGSVAEQAGIKSGDIIKKVDDVEYTGEQLDAVSSKVKGEEGTNVKITILRDNEEKEFLGLQAHIDMICEKNDKVKQTINPKNKKIVLKFKNKGDIIETS